VTVIGIFKLGELGAVPHIILSGKKPKCRLIVIRIYKLGKLKSFLHYGDPARI
jgi:hypothetical protein